MEESRVINKQKRKGWLLPAAILFVLLIGLFLVIKFNTTMNATKSVRGQVVDSATGTPVEGATIMIADGTHEHPDIASQSDEQGTFHLPSLIVPGTYTLLIRHNDQSKKVKVNITSDSSLKISL